MFVVTVKFEVNTRKYPNFMILLRENAEASLKEVDCYQFDVCIDAEKNHIFLYEVYSNEAAFDLHLTTEHFLSFNQVTQSMIDTKSIEVYEQVFVSEKG